MKIVQSDSRRVVHKAKSESTSDQDRLVSASRKPITHYQLSVREHIFCPSALHNLRARRGSAKNALPAKDTWQYIYFRSRAFPGSSPFVVDKPLPRVNGTTMVLFPRRFNSLSAVHKGACRAPWECTAPPRPSTAAHSIWWYMRFLKQKCISRVTWRRYARGFYARTSLYIYEVAQVRHGSFYTRCLGINVEFIFS